MNSKTLVYTILSVFYWVFSSLIFIYVIFLIFFGLLIPYDVVPDEARPPLGSFSRLFNDYFENQGGGKIWFSAVLIIGFLVLFFSLIRGRKLPLYEVLLYIAIMNSFFGACVIIFNILGGLFQVNNFNWVAIFGAFASLLLVWYLQVSLFFLKDKSKI